MNIETPAMYLYVLDIDMQREPPLKLEVTKPYPRLYRPLVSWLFLLDLVVRGSLGGFLLLVVVREMQYASSVALVDSTDLCSVLHPPHQQS